MLKVLYSFLIIIFYLPYLVFVFYRKIINKEHTTKFKEKIVDMRNLDLAA